MYSWSSQKKQTVKRMGAKVTEIPLSIQVESTEKDGSSVSPTALPCHRDFQTLQLL